MNYEIIPMTETDIKQAAEIERLSIAEPWSEKAFLSELDNETAIMLCAKCAGGSEVYGFLTASFVLDEVNINNVAVAEKYRKNGIGQALLERLFDIVNDFAVFIMLEVRESNASAIKLYERAGFIQVGLRKNFYNNPCENAVLMTKTIT